MRKNLYAAISLCFFCGVENVWADRQEGCDAAVDVADSLNVNTQADCDYSDEGLNGYFRKAFSAKQEKEVLTQETLVTPDATVSRAQVATVTQQSEQSLKVVVDQWAVVPLARTQLLPKMLAVCPQGFRVVYEEYRPIAMGRIELTLGANCIN